MIKGFLFNVHSRIRHPELIFYFILLKIKKMFRIEFEFSNNNNQSKSIDIVILTLPKDFELLDLVIDSLSNMMQKINKIFIVAPSNPEIILFCETRGLRFVDEKSILGYGKESISYIVNGTNRSSWIFQQLLKLSGEQITELPDYFIIDSDTIITKPIKVIEQNKYVFFQNEEWHQAYFDSFKKIFGYNTKNRLSFTSHMMIFNHDMLRSMKKEMELKHGMSWDKVYLSTINQNEASCVSDYDTYANWVLCNHPEKVTQKPLYNKAFSRKKLGEITKNINIYSQKYQTISFHSYII